MASRLRGRVEWASRYGLAGWARDPGRPTPLVLEASIEGRAVGTAIADAYRPDLGAAGEGDGFCAFELWFDHAGVATCAQREGVEVHLRTADGAALPGTPFRLPPNCGPAPRLPAMTEGIALVVDDAAPDAGRDAGSAALLSHMEALRTLGFDVVFAPRADALEHARAHAGRIRLAYLHRLGAMLDLAAALRMVSPGVRLIFATADLASLRVARQANVTGRPGPGAGLGRAEAAAIAGADAVVTHSPVEAALMRRLGLGPSVHVVPWAVAVREQPPPWSERRGVGFVGNFGHAPNLDAARVLLDEVMPLLWRRAPVRCVIAGYGVPSRLRARAGGGVRVMERLDDVEDLWRQVRVSAAPLRFGAGVKGKVLDSLAGGVPCVCSAMAAEGLALPPALLADGAVAQAEALWRLHEDGDLNAAAAQAGQDMIRTRHDPTTVARALGAAVTAALATPPYPNRNGAA